MGSRTFCPICFCKGVFLTLVLFFTLVGTTRAQLPIGSMVGAQRPTADVWFDNWRYDQSPRAVIAPNMFGDAIFNRPLGFTTPGLSTVIPAVPTTVRQLAGVLQQSAPPGAALFVPTVNTTLLTQASPDLLFLGQTAPNTNFNTRTPITNPLPGTLGLAENAAITNFILTQFAQPGERVVYNPTSAANLAGANYNVLLIYDLIRDGSPGGVISDSIRLGLPNPVGGGLVGRTKISTSNSPLPRDRIIYDYDFYNDTVLRAGGQGVHRQSVGFEKAFLDGCVSVELRLPFASTVSNLSTDGLMSGGSTELGNLFLTLKGLVMSTPIWTISGGIGVSLPTANDTRLNALGQRELLRISNDTPLLCPFAAVLFTPSDRLFVQAWCQGSFDTMGNRVQALSTNGTRIEIGKLNDPTQLYVDLQMGYWIMHPASYPKGILRALAPFCEVHYNTGLGSPETVTAGPISVFDSNGRFDNINLTSGVMAQLYESVYLTGGLSAPITNTRNRFSDLQLGVRMTWYFGGTAGAREQALPTF